MRYDATNLRTILAASVAGLLLSSCTAADPGLRSPVALTSATPPNATTQNNAIATDATTQPVELTRPVLEAAATLSLEDAVRSALAWHPSIDEAVGRVNQSDAQIDVARAGYYPSVRGGINSSYNNSSDRAVWQPKANVSASQMIYDFGKVSGAVDARTAGAEASRAQLLLGVDVVIRDTANALIEVQRYRTLLQVARAQVGDVQAIADLVRQRSDSGASTRSDQVQAEARVQAAQSTVQEISAQLQRWEAMLANLIGWNGQINVSSEVPSWLASACDVAEPEWSSVPAVLVAEHQRAEALAELNRSRAQLFPTLSLEASGGYDLNRRATSTNQPEFSVGLNLSGSIFDGGATAASNTAATHALNSADAAIRNARLQVSTNLMEARAQTSSLQGMLSTLSSRSSLLTETRNLYRQQYTELGTRTLLDLLNAEQELHQAAFDRANITHDLRRLGLDCMFSSGRSRQLFALDGMTIRGVRLQP